ncbi:MAG: cell division protein FtsQ/DivIB [Candidatus Omnitrophota bacterium]
MAKRAKKPPIPEALRVRNLLPIAALVGAAFIVYGGLSGFIARSEYFRVSKVDIAIIGTTPLGDKAVAELLSVHRGQRIFDIDLVHTRAYILANYPEVRTLLINRLLPDKLLLSIRPRRPIAQVNIVSGFFLIDSEGVVMPEGHFLVRDGLPIINGIDPRVIASSAGKQCPSPGLKKALRLLEVIGELRFAQGHELHMIDVADEKNLSLYIEGGVEIKIGGENFRERMVMLIRTLEAGRLDKNQIRYVDLRFGNVVIGPR